MAMVRFLLRMPALAALACLLALAPVSAMAFTVTPSATSIDNRGTTNGAITMPSDIITALWAGTGGAGNTVVYAQGFHVSDPFRVLLTSYSSDGTGGSIVNMFSGLPTDGSASARDGRTSTTLVSETLGPDDVGRQIGTFSPGTYTLGFFEDGTSNTGVASFAIAPVPLPAGLGLLLLGLGGLMALRRLGGSHQA